MFLHSRNFPNKALLADILRVILVNRVLLLT